MSENDQLFDEPELITTTEGISPEAPVVADAPETEATGRDERGRFAPKSEKGETISAPPAPETVEARHIPITALLDEREKRQQLERQLEALRREQPRQEPAPLPDIIEDPQGYTQAVFNTLQQQIIGERLIQSRFFAERELGAEFIGEMMEFFDGQPHAVSAQFLSSPSPMHAAAEWYKKQKAMMEIGPDPVAYRTRLEADLRKTLEAELREKLALEYRTQAPSSRPRTPPQSLASVPAAARGPSPTASSDPLFD